MKISNIDKQGYRPNIGIIIANDDNKLLLAKRVNQDSWQFPQGGIKNDEKELDALFRELYEEVGLNNKQVTIIAKTPKWLRYNLPDMYIRRDQHPLCIGQKQVWYLLKINTADDNVKLNLHDVIEFDDWQWVDYWSPIENIIDFKKNIYEDVLKSFAPVLFNNNHKIPKCYNRPLKCTAIIN